MTDLYNRKEAQKRGLTESDMNVLDNLYLRLYSVLQRPLHYFKSYEDAVHYVESLEIVIQDVWKFEYNPNYQTYRFRFKECSCPKMDNFELRGTGMFCHSRSCPVHEFVFK